jgi:DNA-directed RNA polymerase specialized sigma24 family protein
MNAFVVLGKRVAWLRRRRRRRRRGGGLLTSIGGPVEEEEEEKEEEEEEEEEEGLFKADAVNEEDPGPGGARAGERRGRQK